MDRIYEAREFLAELSASPPKLPYDPTLLPKLFKKMADGSHASMGLLAEFVEKSQALAAKILSVANSACYGLQSTVTSLQRAVQVLGILELRSLVILFSVSGAIPPNMLPANFPARDLWKHQIITAQIARKMASLISGSTPEAPVIDPESMYAAGLLHDLGKLVLAARRSEDWAKITELSNSKHISFSAAEDEYWGIDHGTIASILLKKWDLPELLTETISWHHHPAMAPKYCQEVYLLAAANQLSILGIGEDGLLPQEITDLLPQYTALLNQNISQLKSILESSQSEQLASFT